MAAVAAEADTQLAVGVRLISLNLPEDEGEGLGFRLTRTLWDPYPWIREVTAGSRADVAGLTAGDCILQADGKDLLGLPVGQVAGIIRGDGEGRGLSLLVWSCGVDPQDDPELLWSCGGGVRGERARRALSGVVRALACSVCSATARRALCCARSHIYCEGCWTRLQRCALCREALPAKDSPYARNLVAEQVFEAIAVEYEIKDTLRKPTETVSARTSPHMSPSVTRRGQYQISMLQKTKKTVQFGDRFHQNYASDPNLSTTSKHHFIKNSTYKSTNEGESSQAGNTTNSQCQSCHNCICKNSKQRNITQTVRENTGHVPDVNIENNGDINKSSCGVCSNIPLCGPQHKLVTRLRPACSLVDLKTPTAQSCGLSRSLNSIDTGNSDTKLSHGGSLDNMKTRYGNCDGSHIMVFSAPPVYVLTCDHASK